MKDSTPKHIYFTPRRTGGLILFFFFLSGVVGLIYEILWTRLLRFVMGNTVFSITTVLCAFMGGLALGGYIGGKIIDRRDDPLRIYALLEGLIGIYSLFLPGIINATFLLYRLIYQNYHTSFYLFSLIRFLLCGSLLLFPATLMGALLPVLTKFFVRSSDRIGWDVGRLYAVNTFGAVVGSFSAGFLLLPTLGLKNTINLAVMINFIICFCVYFLHHTVRPLSAECAGEQSGIKKTIPPKGKTKVASKNMLLTLLIGYCFSGFAALVYEISWTRILSLIVGSSVYAFSLMLTAFISGLALGSILFSRFIDRRKDLLLTLAVCEILIGLSALLVVPFFGRLPLFIVDIIITFSHSFWLLQAVEFTLLFLLMLLPTMLMGAAFPLATRIYTCAVTNVGSSVGTVYAANMLGSILGSFIGAFMLIPLLGIQKTILAAVLINIMVGSVFIIMCRTLSTGHKGIIVTAVIVGVIIVTSLSPGWDVSLISSGAYVNTMKLSKITNNPRAILEQELQEKKVIYHKEGVSTTVTIKESAQGERYFLVNGKGDASSTKDLPTQELLAHIPLLLHSNAKSVLVIGLASGITLGSAGLYPLEQLDCIEISPESIAASHYFDHLNYNILEDPRVSVIIEDGRNHVALTNKTYDVIISEPSNPWIAGIADLFTQEFFHLCRKRLNPGGIACVWIHAYTLEDKIFRSIVRTFQSVFPYCSLWETALGIDFLLIGSEEKITTDYGTIVTLLEDEGIANDLKRINSKNAVDVLAHFIMDEKNIKEYVNVDGVSIHTDDNALLEFAAPQTLYKPNIAEPLLRAVNTLRDSQPPSLTYRGMDPNESMEIKERIARLKQAKGHIMNGTLYLSQDESNLAIEAFEKAMSLNPDELSTLFHYVEYMANIYCGQGDYKKAIETLEKARAIRPNNTEIMVKMGVLYMQKNNMQKAEELFNAALSIDQNCATAYSQLGYLHLRKHELQKALSCFNTFLRLEPENPEAYLFLAKTHQFLGRNNEAIKAWEKAVDLQPTLTIAHLNLGNAYFEMGDFERAKSEWQQALSEKGVDIPTHLIKLGTFYFQSKLYDKAIKAWEKAGELKADDPQILYHIALAYYQQGHYIPARAQLKESLRIKPDNHSALMLLQRIEGR
ncbi:MAG: fused MFS/spermidine synthase [bacterium]